MGINRIKRDFTKEPWYQDLDEYRKKETAHDQQLIVQILNDVNKAGYYVVDIEQLAFMDESDFDTVSPILMKYFWKFDRRDLNYHLIGCVAKKGNIKYTQYFIDEFKKPNDDWDRSDPFKWNLTRRWSLSNAIKDISDKRYINDYIELIKNEDTHEDSAFLIELLGKFRKEEGYELLKNLLNDKEVFFRREAIETIVKFKDHKDEIIDLINPMTNDSSKIVQNAAKKHSRNYVKINV